MNRIATLLSGALCTLLPLLVSAQQGGKPQLNEDYTFNTTSVEARKLHYHPDGKGVFTIDGTARFNRALYGAHTGFRMECSDRPEFGIYLPGMGGNLRFTLPGDDLSRGFEMSCTARYEAGRMQYEGNGVAIEAQVMRKGKNLALWRIENISKWPKKVGVLFGGVTGKKFYRNGDLGVDDPECFSLDTIACADNRYIHKNGTFSILYNMKEPSVVQLIAPLDNWKTSRLPHLQGEMTLEPGEVRYIAYRPTAGEELTQEELAEYFATAEAHRKALANSFRIETPDPWINPIGGALAIAADGIWSGRTWLHGAVGWRSSYTGWRGAYVGDAIGWHDRARTHFRTYAENMVRDVAPTLDHPRQDSTLNLARAEKRWGTPMYSNGYICRRPHRREMSHYDMNLVYIDALLRHIRATGDEDFMREIFPTLQLHLAWEKRNFDPDGDHLYDGYACIWASDALYYNGGAVTHSSAYNYFANRETARIAERIGEDPTPYREEAKAIEKAMLETLWYKEGGHWAEYKDLMGHGRLHTTPALWTIYHAIDSEVGRRMRTEKAVDYIARLPHLPVRSPDLEEEYALPATSDWQPYIWSINNVATAEVMHAALAYWQADKYEEAFRLMKGMALDNMYLGTSPLNFGQISYLDAARGECYRDFADPIGVWARALTEGLFGIRPDLIAGKVTIQPGFPRAWDHASIHLPKIDYRFERKGFKETYTIDHRYPKGTVLELKIEGYGLHSVKIYDQAGKLSDSWTFSNKEAEWAWGRYTWILGGASHYRVEVMYTTLQAPATATPNTKCEQPIPAQSAKPQEKVRIRTIDLQQAYNARVTEIYRNEYLSPRPKVTTLQIPKQGYGDWCHPKASFEVDDAGLREAVARRPIDTESGLLEVKLDGRMIPFRLAHKGKNILYTSLWDNYPTRATVPLSGRGSRLVLLMAGSTNHMQSHIANGEIRICYTDGTSETLALVNPDNWPSIEQIGYADGYAFRAPALPRVWLKNGRCSRYLAKELHLEGVNPMIEGGAATIVEMTINPEKELQGLTLETLSNDVVIGLMGATIVE
ncbi:MAG: DUF4450 domain-containing protein [Alistipes sp.]|nr:DUF4450 domain-containing protein [Alistipes sp.]